MPWIILLVIFAWGNVPSLVINEMNSLTHSCIHSLASFAILALSGKAFFMMRATGAKLRMLASSSSHLSCLEPPRGSGDLDESWDMGGGAAMQGCVDGAQDGQITTQQWISRGKKRGLTIGYREPSVLLFYTFELVAGEATRLWISRIIHLSFVFWRLCALVNILRGRLGVGHDG